MDSFFYLWLLGKWLFVVFLFLSVVPVLVWAERRGAAWIQNRRGPNRVGPLGLLQPLADAIKFIWKEDRIFGHTRSFFYVLAPLVAVVPAFMTVAVIPFADSFWWHGREVHFQIARLDPGLLYLFAFSSLGVYGLILAGWSSHSKYALFGALRASAQMISYEVALALSVLGIFLVFGTLDPVSIVRQQGEVLLSLGPFQLPKWGIFVQPLGFLLFLPAVFAECNRLPFDLPEGESEIIAGFHLEYGGLKFALFFMAEYLHVLVASCLLVTLYFGGWQLLPGFSSMLSWGGGGLWMRAFLQLLSFLIKVFFFVWVFIWVRWTLPRFRYDQVMDLGWKVLLPLGLLNTFATAFFLL